MAPSAERIRSMRTRMHALAFIAKACADNVAQAGLDGRLEDMGEWLGRLDEALSMLKKEKVA